MEEPKENDIDQISENEQELGDHHSQDTKDVITEEKTQAKLAEKLTEAKGKQIEGQKKNDPREGRCSPKNKITTNQ